MPPVQQASGAKARIIYKLYGTSRTRALPKTGLASWRILACSVGQIFFFIEQVAVVGGAEWFFQAWGAVASDFQQGTERAVGLFVLFPAPGVRGGIRLRFR